ncbi:MAG: hypothetical protein HY562_09945 [Ignavibacteriales bacterium]|nr:hypothetical protein [Ignavibacteriales bacterium]
MRSLNFDVYLGYVLAGVFLVFGLFVVFGITIPENVPSEFRISLGVVLLLWGLYRFVLTRLKSTQQTEDAP